MLFTISEQRVAAYLQVFNLFTSILFIHKYFI